MSLSGVTTNLKMLCIALGIVLLSPGNIAVAAAIQFQEAIKSLRAAGVTKVLIGEEHSTPYNMDLAAHCIMGANAGGKPLGFWREANPPEKHADRLAQHYVDFNTGKTSDRAVREEVFKQIVLVTCSGSLSATNAFMAAHKEVTRTVIDGSVSLHMLRFQDPKQRDFGELIASPDFQIGMMGLAHATYRYAGPDKLGIPFNPPPSNFAPAIPPYVHPKFSMEAQKDMWDGYARALKGGPAILVMYAESIFMNLAVVRNYYEKQGYVILTLEMPGTVAGKTGWSMSANFAASIVAPCSFTSVMVAIHDRAQRTTRGLLQYEADHPCRRPGYPERDEL